MRLGKIFACKILFPSKFKMISFAIILLCVLSNVSCIRITKTSHFKELGENMKRFPHHNADCYTVIKIWEDMGGLPVRNVDCCLMKGVYCYYSKVIKIDWINKQLSGQIPPEIGNLKNLTWL